MSLPAGPDANRKLAFYRRAKRRSKRDLAEFTRQGITPLAPFDFGITAAGGSSANTLTLPANSKFVLEHGAVTLAERLGITDQTTSFLNLDAGISGSHHRIGHLFRKDQDIQVARVAGALAGAVNVYFDDQFGKLTLIGTATFT